MYIFYVYITLGSLYSENSTCLDILITWNNMNPDNLKQYEKSFFIIKVNADRI